MGLWPFRRSRAEEDAGRLLAAVQSASRRPVWFGPGRIPDTLEGRFEAVTLNASLALLRLKADRAAGELAQHFTDALFSQFDAGLREHGVGDTSVPKRIHKLAGDFYGRAEVYGRAITDRDVAGLTDAIVRNVGLPAEFAGRLAAHLAGAAAAQQTAPLASLFEAAAWPEFPE